jgi:hypothetical protein
LICGIIRPINWKKNYDNLHLIQSPARYANHDDGDANAHPHEAGFSLKRSFPETPIQELPLAALFLLILAWFEKEVEITNEIKIQYPISNTFEKFFRRH